MAVALFYILIFPGILFIGIFSLMAEYVDRKLYAKLQNRMGPPWYQPFADFIKLVAKEDIVPEEADLTIFRMMPVLAATSTVCAFFYIPLWGTHAVFSFEGDVIVVLYLLTIPMLTFFLGGWYSRGVFSRIGAIRAITQFFAYETPLFLSILAPAMLADSWSLDKITIFYSQRPLFVLFNIVGFAVALVALLGKLEKVPFDIPEAETEIVAGAFTEYGGRLLAIFRIAIDMEMVVASSLLAAVFLPFGMQFGHLVGFTLYIVKVLFIVALLAVLRTLFARLRIDQMINFCWKYVAPLAFLQLLADLILKGIYR
jgi:NADH-quinone oxidoreductase subunit H